MAGNPAIAKRILFFPDKISDDDSGARSGRATLKSLLELGHTVAVFTSDADLVTREDAAPGVVYIKPQSLMRANSHFYERRLMVQFRELLADFRPDFFFMAGSVQKPAMLARVARKAGIKTIFLFYGTDYYCLKGFAGLASGPCYKCIDNGAQEALRHGCIKHHPKVVHFAKSALVRRQLRQEILRSHKVVGYSDDQLDVYERFGVATERLAKISLQFDPTELAGVATEDGERFLVTGQPTMEKGWHTLAAVFAKCVTAPKVDMCFKNLEVEQRVLRDFGLATLVETGMISTRREIVERQEIVRMIASARAVLIPSYYPTTGEFVLSESLLMGKPVVVFDAGAHKNIITHGLNGMMAPVGDLEAFARNMDAVNSTPELRMALSRGARELGKVLFADDARLASLSKLFE